VIKAVPPLVLNGHTGHPVTSGCPEFTTWGTLLRQIDVTDPLGMS